MNGYVIQQLAEDESVDGAFAPRGAIRRLFETRNFETIVSGPAETGKTWGCLHYAHLLLLMCPKAQGLMVRKIYADIVGTAVQSYLRILAARPCGVRAYGGERPQWFDYPNGSRFWVAGFDNPGKALSSERDFIYVNQAEELDIADWETLGTRATGRGAVMPWTRIFGDCNPGPPEHWILQRSQAGKLLLLESRHEDNPTLYGEDGELTDQGRRTMGVLDGLTGVRRQRYRFGRWVRAEGVVYDGWDAAVHVIDDMPPGWEKWRKVRAVDFGFTNPFVCQWWAIDYDGRMYLYREIYRTQTLVEDHAREIRRLTVQDGGEDAIEVTVADHDAEDRATLKRHGIDTVPAYKSIREGLDAVAARLRKAGDDKPRIFVLQSALAGGRDDVLVEAKLPTSTAQEFDSYVWPKGQDGKPRKEVPMDMNNHGMDAMRYAVARIDHVGRNRPLKPEALRRIVSYDDVERRLSPRELLLRQFSRGRIR